jgi:hypothetical protein
LLAILSDTNHEYSLKLVGIHEAMDNVGPAPFKVDEDE